MKKNTKDLQGKSVQHTDQDIATVRQEIARMILEKKTNPQKDTNAIGKKKKHLAVLLTIRAEKT